MVRCTRRNRLAGTHQLVNHVYSTVKSYTIVELHRVAIHDHLSDVCGPLMARRTDGQLHDQDVDRFAL